MSLQSIIANAAKLVKSNSPEILTGLGVAGVAATAYLSAKASWRSRDALAMAPADMPTKERAKVVWKLYIPPVVAGVATAACVIGSSRGSSKRTAAAVTAYSLTERAFAEYKDKVVEQVGKVKEEKIRTEIAQAQVNANPPGSNVMVLGSGHVLCCEAHTGRYFRSNIETLKKAQNEINHRLVRIGDVRLEELYDILGLPYNDQSQHVGWDSDKLLEMTFSWVGSPEGEPCLSFGYNYVKPMP